MALYMLQAKYTPEAIRNIAESGSNREEEARTAVAQYGGKLIGFYGMMGEDYHVAIIVEYDQLPNYLGTVLTIALGGAIADFKTIALYTASDVVNASKIYQENKGAYSPPPRS